MKTDQIPSNHKKTALTTSKTLVIALEFGFIIAIPLLALTTLGKWLANRYDNQLFLFVGIILAIVSSTLFLLFRVYKIYKELIDQ